MQKVVIVAVHVVIVAVHAACGAGGVAGVAARAVNRPWRGDGGGGAAM